MFTTCEKLYINNIYYIAMNNYLAYFKPKYLE